MHTPTYEERRHENEETTKEKHEIEDPPLPPFWWAFGDVEWALFMTSSTAIQNTRRLGERTPTSPSRRTQKNNEEDRRRPRRRPNRRSGEEADEEQTAASE